MYWIDCSNKLRKKSAYCWSLLSKKKLISCSNRCSWRVFWAKLIWNYHDAPTDSLLQQVLYITAHLHNCAHINTCYNLYFLHTPPCTKIPTLDLKLCHNQNQLLLFQLMHTIYKSYQPVVQTCSELHTRTTGWYAAITLIASIPTSTKKPFCSFS